MGFCLLLQTHLLPLILHSFPCTSQTEPLEVPKCAIIIPSACLCICSSLWLEGHIAKPPSSLSSSPISLEKPVFTIPAWWTYEYAHCTLYSTAHTQRYLLLFTSVSLLDCEWLVVRIDPPSLCMSSPALGTRCSKLTDTIPDPRQQSGISLRSSDSF